MQQDCRWKHVLTCVSGRPVCM